MHLSHIIMKYNICIRTCMTLKWKLRDHIDPFESWGMNLNFTIKFRDWNGYFANYFKIWTNLPHSCLHFEPIATSELQRFPGYYFFSWPKGSSIIETRERWQFTKKPNKFSSRLQPMENFILGVFLTSRQGSHVLVQINNISLIIYMFAHHICL